MTHIALADTPTRRCGFNVANNR